MAALGSVAQLRVLMSPFLGSHQRWLKEPHKKSQEKGLWLVKVRPRGKIPGKSLADCGNLAA